MTSKKKTKRIGYSCFDEKVGRSMNPAKHIKHWGRNLKYSYQRIKYGYCDRDVWSIDWWFLNVVPNMLEDLKEESHGYPEAVRDIAKASLGIEDEEDADWEVLDDKSMKVWKSILSKMIFLFREANEDTCTRKNQFEAQYDKAFNEFSKKYGAWGDKLKTKAEREKEKRTGYRKLYSLSDIPEYQDLYEHYHEEERALCDYRNECKDKALELFKTWFHHLWD